jgi:hypothetical protein
VKMHRSYDASTSQSYPCLIPQTQQLPRCPICNKAVALETANTDEDGHAIHEECYILKLHLWEATKSEH